MDHSGKNFPVPTTETEGYWKGCRDHQLLIQQCTACGHFQFYPRLMCTACISRNVVWFKATGRGKVKSFTVIHRAISKAYAKETPYVLAIIELEEGPTMMSSVVNCNIKEMEVGMKVEVTFEDWSEEISIPKFRPITNE